MNLLKGIALSSMLTINAGAQAILPQPQIQQVTNGIVTCFCWTRNPEPDISSYVIYAGTNVGQYNMSTNVGNVDRACVTNMVFPNITNYFTVTAMNTNGLESDPSDPVYTYFTPNFLEVLDSYYEPGRISLRYRVDDGQKPHLSIRPSTNDSWYSTTVGVISSTEVGGGIREEIVTMPLPIYQTTPTTLYLKHWYAHPVGDCGVLKPQLNFKKL